MQYVYIVNNRVQELIPEINPVFPNVPIEERYTAEFLAQCITCSEGRIQDEGITQGMCYNASTDTFYWEATPAPQEYLIETSAAELDEAYRSGVNSYE